MEREDKTNLDHDEIVLNDTVSNETSKRSDRFDSNIEFSSSTRFIISFTNSVNLLVEPAKSSGLILVEARRVKGNILSSMMVSVLSSSGNRVHNLGRMPCSNTSDLSKSLMSLSRQLLGSPSDVVKQ